MIRVEKVGNKYVMRGNGVKVTPNKLYNVFSASELKVDLLDGKLKYSHEPEPEELQKDVYGQHWDCLPIYRDDLLTYLEIKNAEIITSEYTQLREDNQKIREVVENLEKQISTLGSYISQIHKSIGKPKITKLKDVHQYFPEYKLASLRNMLGKSRYFDTKRNCWVGKIEIAEFRLFFYKPKTGKVWVADDLEFTGMKSITTNGRFQQEIRNRLKHGNREGVIEILKMMLL